MPIAKVTKSATDGTVAWSGDGAGDAETELVPPPELAWSEDDELDLPPDEPLPPMPPMLLLRSWRATVGIAATVLAASGAIAAVVAWPDDTTTAATVTTTTTAPLVPPSSAVGAPVAPPLPSTATVTVTAAPPSVAAPTTATPTATQPVTVADQEARFLQSLNMSIYGPRMESDAQALAYGRQICQLYQRGYTPAQVLYAMEDQGVPNVRVVPLDSSAETAFPDCKWRH